MLRPLGPKIVIRPDKIEDTDPTWKAVKKAGLAIPETSKEKKMEQQAITRGTVLAIGSTAFHAPVGDGTPWTEVGKRVGFAKYAGVPILDPETDEILLLLNDEDLQLEISGEKDD